MQEHVRCSKDLAQLVMKCRIAEVLHTWIIGPRKTNGEKHDRTGRDSISRPVQLKVQVSHKQSRKETVTYATQLLTGGQGCLKLKYGRPIQRKTDDSSHGEYSCIDVVELLYSVQ